LCHDLVDCVPDLSLALAKAFAEFVPDQVIINIYIHIYVYITMMYRCIYI